MYTRTLALILLLAELTSFAGYFFPWLNTVGFFAIIAAALVLSSRRLEYGPYFVLADLILGGKTGALFSFEYGGFLLSLRMALFIVVMSVWVGKVVASRIPSPGLRPPSPLGRGDAFNPHLPAGEGWGEGILKWWGLLGVAVLWGMMVGVIRGNDLGNLFLDVNGYFYGALILPAVWVSMRMNANRGELMRMFGVVFFAATTLLALKTLFSVYLFTHGLNNFIAANLIPFYRWIRDTGVGEITWREGNFARVFFQSHIYNIVAWFMLVSSVLNTPSNSPSERGRNCFAFPPLLKGKLGGVIAGKEYTLLVLNTAVIVVSLSRSFWVGVTAGLALLFMLLMMRTRSGGVQDPTLRIVRRFTPAAAVLVGSLVLSILLIFLVARFPFPRPSDADLTQAAQSRFQFEAGAASRWNLLPVMWSNVREHPVVGSGFGRTVTYISNDPRIREVSITGEYTTYAFEWGWVDIWVKMGFVGLVGLIGIILALARALYKNAGLAGFAGLASLVSITTIHFFTPYLNHPLGFGVLIGLSLIAATTTPRG